MPYDPDRHRRRSIRLRGYDYSQPGAYFVTICAHGRQLLFAAPDDTTRLTDAGRMVARWRDALGRKFPAVQTDAFVVMPDHIHGIVIITEPIDHAHRSPIDDPPAGRIRISARHASPMTDRRAIPMITMGRARHRCRALSNGSRS